MARLLFAMCHTVHGSCLDTLFVISLRSKLVSSYLKCSTYLPFAPVVCKHTPKQPCRGLTNPNGHCRGFSLHELPWREWVSNEIDKAFPRTLRRSAGISTVDCGRIHEGSQNSLPFKFVDNEYHLHYLLDTIYLIYYFSSLGLPWMCLQTFPKSSFVK